jgi:hypothetical protein
MSNNNTNTIGPFIIQTMVMRLSEKESLEYLKDKGFTISRDTFYRHKRKIKESRFERLSLLGKEGFVDQHLERIDQLETINRECWKLYNAEKNNMNKASILEKIAELQTYISPYYDASQYIMEKSIKNNNNETKENKSISVL